MQDLLNLDKRLLLLINQGLSNSVLDWLMVGFSMRLIWLGFFGFLLADFWVNKRRREVRILLFLGLMLVATDVFITECIKPYVARLRPCKEMPDILHVVYGCAGKYGFPSNHSANAMTLATGIFLLYSRKIGLFAFAVAIIVGFSRVYLGAHYPLDVFGGFLVGGLMAALLSYLLKRSRFSAKILGTSQNN